MSNATATAQVVLIELDGVEVHESPRETVHSWEEAQHTLVLWGETAPESGQGYDKVDFRVLFTNGVDYEGRFDLQRGGRESDGSDLKRHVREFCLLRSGRWRPVGFLKDHFETMLKGLGPETIAFYASILDTCDVGKEPPQEQSPEPDPIFGEVISTYTRAQAIADGVLVDVSQRMPDLIQNAGFKFHVAMTSEVWRLYVEVPKGVECQDIKGRLWDILWMLRLAAKGNESDTLTFKLYVRNDNRSARLVILKAVCGPGDNMEPVVTIMLPDQD